jgi:hypothetical protein
MKAREVDNDLWTSCALKVSSADVFQRMLSSKRPWKVCIGWSIQLEVRWIQVDS